MSTIDSGVNSFATVATVDFGRLRRRKTESHVAQARVITVVVGLAVTLFAVFFDRLTGTADIPTILPRPSTRWQAGWEDCSWPAC